MGKRAEGEAARLEGRGEKPPEVRIERLERYFRGLGDGYQMLQRAIEAQEDYRQKLAETEVTPTFRGFLEKAERRALETVIRAVEDVERPIPGRYRKGRPLAALS